MTKVKKEKETGKVPFARFIKGVEKVGSKMPHPVFLFLYLGISFIILSVIGAAFGWGNPLSAGQNVKSLLSTEGVYYMFTQFINNFSTNGYSAGVGGGSSIFGTILLLTMAVGVGTSTGYWNTLIKKMTVRIPKAAVSYVVVFIGGFSSIASDAGYVVFIPLAAIIFKGYGRHPIAGITAAFSGVSAGFSATLLPGASDAIFSNIWDMMAKTEGLKHGVNWGDIFTPTSMWFFQAVSLFMISAVGGLVTDKIIEPMLQPIAIKDAAHTEATELTKEEKSGMKYANIAMLSILLFYIVLSWPGFGPLAYGYSADGNNYVMQSDMMDWVRNSIFMKSISLNLGIIFFVAGIAYGVGAKTITKKEDVVKHQVKSLQGIGSYIVVSIVALNAIMWFNWTNLGAWLAGNIAQWLQDSGMGKGGIWILLPATLILTMLINIVISGMSSKAYILGPIILALYANVTIANHGVESLDFSGGQNKDVKYDLLAMGVAYRIGDSITNIITPIMSYFVIILAFAQMYVVKEEEFGVGQLIGAMMPYSIAFTVSWIVLFILWYLMKIPFGL